MWSGRKRKMTGDRQRPAGTAVMSPTISADWERAVGGQQKP